jgi:pimeloyl-ACP methyl ester carboxylesterase
MPYAQAIRPPSMLLAATDIPRAAMEMGSLSLSMPLLATAPRGDGHPVLVLPGFGTSDLSTATLRTYLKWLGYDVHAWGLGLNLGHRTVGPARERLVARIREIEAVAGQKISLVGWSLGGIMARTITLHNPELVRQIITIGSPFTGNPYATSIWKLYQRISGVQFDSEAARQEYLESATVPAVPSTAIYSKLDGITAWENCVDPHDDATDNVEVYSSHMGLCVNPAVLWLIADRLAQNEYAWQPFDGSSAPMRWMYPSSGWAG